MNALSTPAAEAARILSGLSQGERAWFWWRAGSQAALLLQPLSLDPTMARLKAQISGITPADDVRPVSGILQVGQGGRIGLLSAAAGDSVLPALADWVLDHHTTHPDLARLHRAQFFEASDSGTVSAVFEDDTLWAELPAPVALDDTTRTAAVLRGLGEGERAWFWMAQTESGRAVMLAALVSEDADGERLTSRARALRLGGGIQDAVQGVARREGRVLTLTTATFPKCWSEIVAALIGQGGDLFRPLRRARLVHLEESTVQKTEALPPHHELSETAALLRAQGGGWFWFTTATRHGSCLLILRDDRDALKEAARLAGGDGRTIRGRMRVVADRIELQTKDSDDLRSELLEWAKSASRRWPDLRRLKGVRITTIES